MLSPNSPGSVTVWFWVAGFAGALVLVLLGQRRYGNDLEVMSAIAVIATVLGSPHLLIYDTFVLIIPVAVAWRRGALTARRIGLLAALYSVPIAFSPVLVDLQIQHIGRGVGLELPALLLSCWLLVKWDRESTNIADVGDSAQSNSRDGGVSASILANA